MINKLMSSAIDGMCRLGQRVFCRFLCPPGHSSSSGEQCPRLRRQQGKPLHGILHLQCECSHYRAKYVIPLICSVAASAYTAATTGVAGIYAGRQQMLILVCQVSQTCRSMMDLQKTSPT